MAAAVAACADSLAAVNLRGGDLGSAPVGAVEACCSACAATPGCAAFTFEPWLPGSTAGVCYLKAATGWLVKPAAVEGMLSGTASGAKLPAAPAPRPTEPAKTTAGSYVFEPLTEDQQQRMYELTNVFETGQVRRGSAGGPACMGPGWWEGSGHHCRAKALLPQRRAPL